MELDRIVAEMMDVSSFYHQKKDAKQKSSRSPDKERTRLDLQRYTSFNEELFLAIKQLKEEKPLPARTPEKKKSPLSTPDETMQKKEQEQVGVKYSRLIEKIAYFQHAQQVSAIDYQKMWGYGTTLERSHQSASEQHASSGEQYSSGNEESVGLLTEQHAHSIVERMLQVRRFGDLNRISYQEVERFRYWRLFTHNKVLRRAWEKDSALAYKPPGHQESMV